MVNRQCRGSAFSRELSMVLNFGNTHRDFRKFPLYHAYMLNPLKPRIVVLPSNDQITEFPKPKQTCKSPSFSCEKIKPIFFLVKM